MINAPLDLNFWILRVVNGALEYLAKDLGIADNAVLQGKCVVSNSSLF